MRDSQMRMIAIALAAWMVAAAGCDSEGNDNNDAGGTTDATSTEVDAGCPEIPTLDESATPPDPAETCPTEDTPAPEELMGACCYRHSNADQLSDPEMRMQWLNVVAPLGSTLANPIFSRILNQSIQLEAANWLFRMQGGSADGAVTLQTGYGRRQMDGTYRFSTGAADGDPDAWLPVEMPATLSGERLTADAYNGVITVPIFDETGETLQFAIALRQVVINEATLSEDRSCVGWNARRSFTYEPRGMLSGYIEVDPARASMIDISTISTTLCAAVAGSLNDATYCDSTPQGEWSTPPDSLCDESGCRANTPCMSDVCDPATNCNAWHMIAHFAAAGVDISN